MYNGIYKQNYKSAKKRLLKSEDRSAISTQRHEKPTAVVYAAFRRVVTSVTQRHHSYCCALWIFVGRNILKLHPTLRNQSKELKYNKKKKQQKQTKTQKGAISLANMMKLTNKNL